MGRRIRYLEAEWSGVLEREAERPAPTVCDRIVQGAIRHVIEPIFEKQFAPSSFGFRPGKGCKDALRRVEQLLRSGYRYVVDAATAGFEFLGYRFDKGRRWPRDKSKRKLRATIRRHTPRSSGVSLQDTIHRLNPALRGWFGYFKHASEGMREVDGWVRERLRNILRHQQKIPGRNGPLDRQRWPNAFFADLGLFSLESAHRAARQSMTMAH